MPGDRISVISAFYQRRDLARCFLCQISTLPAPGKWDFEILWGDNGSIDGTTELLQSAKDSRTYVHAFESNLGYAAANNRLALKAHGTVLLFLNYDVVLTEGWITPLLDLFIDRPTLGILGNIQLSVRSQTPDHSGIFFQKDGVPFHFRPSLGQLANLDLLPVPAVTGACLAIRRHLFEEIGGFHEGYRNSYEDIELCLQARRLGYEVALATRSVIWHYIGASPGRQDREAANARLFEQRCGAFARSLARYAPPELCPPTRAGCLRSGPSVDHETLQVFFDRGAGFSEQDSTVHLYGRGRWNRIEISLGASDRPCPLAIRFDPGRSAGQIRFGGLALKRGRLRASLGFLRSRELVALATVGGTALRLKDSRRLCIESTGHDPQVTFRLAELFPTIPEDAVLELWLWSDKPTASPTIAPSEPSKARGWVASLRPRYVMADLMRLSPRGLNGGVKIFVLELLEAIARRHRFRLSIHVVAAPEVCREIAQVARHLKCHPAESASCPQVQAAAAKAQVLYAPLGFSELSRPGLPQVSLLVDLLHRDIAGALPEIEVAIREKWFVETISRSRVLQCNSQFVVDRLHHHYGTPAASTLIVYNAVGQMQHPGARTRPKEPYFFYPANDWPHKNHARLLEAYAEYRRKQTAPWKLKLSGHFSEASHLAGVAARLGLTDSVSILGHLPDREFNSVFTQAAALVFPSRYEGFGIPVLEAFRLEVPVICSRAGSLPEVGADACGYFDCDDTGSISQAMTRVASDADWRSRLIAAGRFRAKAFDLGQEADKLARAFIDVARGG